MMKLAEDTSSGVAMNCVPETGRKTISQPHVAVRTSFLEKCYKLDRSKESIANDRQRRQMSRTLTA